MNFINFTLETNYNVVHRFRCCWCRCGRLRNLRATAASFTSCTFLISPESQSSVRLGFNDTTADTISLAFIIARSALNVYAFLAKFVASTVVCFAASLSHLFYFAFFFNTQLCVSFPFRVWGSVTSRGCYDITLREVENWKFPNNLDSLIASIKSVDKQENTKIDKELCANKSH